MAALGLVIENKVVGTVAGTGVFKDHSVAVIGGVGHHGHTVHVPQIQIPLVSWVVRSTVTIRVVLEMVTPSFFSTYS